MAQLVTFDKLFLIMKTEIGITQKNTDQVVKLLSVELSNEMILYVKTRKAHWNVTGESFMELHKLFEGHYKLLEEAIDEIAEHRKDHEQNDDIRE